MMPLFFMMAFFALHFAAFSLSRLSLFFTALMAFAIDRRFAVVLRHTAHY